MVHSDMDTMHWKLREFLAERNITRLALEKKADVSRVTLYRMTSPDPKKLQQRIDFPTLTAIIAALRDLTGEDVTPDDLLEFVPGPESQPQDEDEALLGTDLGGLGRYEPYDWGEGGEPEGQAVHYVDGEGLYIETDAPST